MQYTAALRRIPVFVVTICFILAAAVSLPSPARAAKAKAEANRYAAIVVDYDTGRVLHAQHADEPRYPASLTKMMTLYMTFDALNDGRLSMHQPLRISAHAAAQPYGIPLRAGQTITVRDAVLAAITKSANNATAVLGEAIGGSESQFAEMMTRKAQQIGMRSTVFKNSSGLPNSQQKTTARDMATLGAALIKHHGKYYDYFSTAEFEWNDGVYRNHNRVLSRYEGADGIKTGFIGASGFNLVASAKRDGRRIVAAVFGGSTATSRDNRMIQLLDAGFERIQNGGGNDPVMASSETGSSFNLISSAKAAEPGSAARAAKPKTSKAATKTKAKAAAANGNWAVQLGAFKKQDAAQATVAKAQANVPAGEPSVEALRADSGMLYRARLTGMSEADARNACSSLKRRNLACTVVSPSAG
ncbi:D-alanyl-D-alanine carboxypeptidase [Ferrovibrio sp.]|uniref:D-alanyl-D-alanine carboxypeptidase n=1 Tax=Ferrovibrio sp. TaxID=1917215 RepID=UPI001B41FA79|nr:D-alanyl-D-alanine carboxypeptidase [Ferrovibrio sp.]MBP7066204.1 D-alanyl-D-alanine carboxypeptidase [Ferrovibrio sp.]